MLAPAEVKEMKGILSDMPLVALKAEALDLSPGEYEYEYEYEFQEAIYLYWWFLVSCGVVH